MSKDTYSYSRVSLWEQCPYKYYMHYIKKIKEIPSEALKRGSDEHHKMETMLKNNELPENNTTLTNFINMYIYNPGVNSFNVEGKFKRREYKEYDLIGKLDVNLTYNNGKVVIIDWKTGYSGDADINQLKFYCLLMLNELPDNFTYFETIFYYLDLNFYNKTLFSVSDILEFEKELISKIEKLRKDTLFEKQPNQWCQYCSFLEECQTDILSNYKLPEKINSMDQVIDSWKKLILFEASATKIKDLIKEYMIKNSKQKIFNFKEFTKASISTTTSLRFGKMTKDELIDLIIGMGTKKSRKELSALKLSELKEIIMEVTK